MLAKTDMDGVRSIAKTLLHLDLQKTEFSPIVVHHPFTSSGIAAVCRNGILESLDLTKSPENFEEWKQSVSKQIDSCDNAYKIYMLVNKPYALTFLKLVQPCLSKQDYV